MPLSQIVNQGSINLASLQAPGVIVVIVPPPLFGQPQPTDTGCVLGTASWGPTNRAVLAGSTRDINTAVGGINGSIAYNDVNDLATHGVIAFTQATAQGVAIGLWLLRISDGTDAPATVNLMDTTSGSALVGGALNAINTGVLGDGIQCTIAAGTASHFFTVTLTAPFLGSRPEIYQNIAGGSTGSKFWTNLQSALALGTNQRGPSNICRLATPNASAVAPVLGTFTLSGGSDGRGAPNVPIVSSAFVGSNTQNGENTGAYAMQGLIPAVNQFWCAGLTDNTVFPTLAAIADTLGAGTIFALPSGTSSTAAVTAVQTNGIVDYNVSYSSGDYKYWYDSVNKQNRLVEEVPFLMGRILALSPEQSPGNKFVSGVVSSQRQLSNFGPYTIPELGQLVQNGILVITNPINAGVGWGIFHGKNTSQINNPVTGRIEYARMVNYLAKSFAASMGVFVDQLQSEDPDDPTRAAVKLSADTLCDALKRNNQIDAYLNTCDLTNNTPASIAQGFLYLESQIRLLASVDFIVINLEAGTTELGALQVTATINLPNAA